MTRRGYTLIEVLVAASIALAVIAAAVGLLTATRKMSNVGDFGSALAEGSIALEILHRDLSCAVQKPDPSVAGVVQVVANPPGLQFILARFDDAGLSGTRVVYRREKLPTGHFRITRQEGTREPSPLPGTYAKINVETFEGAGGPFIRVTLHVLARDATGGPTSGIDEAVLTSLIRVAGPEMLNSPSLRFKFMDGLKSVDLLKGTEGF